MTKVELETGGSVWKMLVKPGDQVAQGRYLIYFRGDENGGPLSRSHFR